MIYINNVFSLNMLPSGAVSESVEIDLDRLRDAIADSSSNKSSLDDEGEHTGSSYRSLKSDVKSVVGHADTAAVLSTLLGVGIIFNRESIILSPDDTLYVAQYSGARLPEGATELPEGSKFRWFMVKMIEKPAREQVLDNMRETRQSNMDNAKRLLMSIGFSDVESDKILTEDMPYEAVQYDGYPNDGLRDGLAKKAGISRELIDSILTII